MAVEPLAVGTGLAYDARGRARYTIRSVERQDEQTTVYRAWQHDWRREVQVTEWTPHALARRAAGARGLSARPNRDWTLEQSVVQVVAHARACAAVSADGCPHLLSMLDVFVDHGTGYWCSPVLADGAPWPRVPLGSTMADVERALHLARELAWALEALHRHRLVHSRLSPECVRVLGAEHVLVVGYETPWELGPRTRALAQGRADRWAAPEQGAVERFAEVGPWTDVYRWGLMAYGLFCEHPNDGPGTASDSTTPGLPAERTPLLDPYGAIAARLRLAGAPAAFCTQVERAMALSPHERPRRAADVLVGWADPPVYVTASGPDSARGPDSATSTTSDSSTALPPVRSSFVRRGAIHLQRHPTVAASVAAFGFGVVVSAVVAARSPVNAPWTDGRSGRDGDAQTTRNASSGNPAGPATGPVSTTAGLVPDEPPPEGMVWIPGGPGQLGSPVQECGRMERESLQSIDLAPFWMDAHEVTQESWWNTFGTQPSASETCWTDCPVESIHWYEALAYANARSRAEGLTECYELDGCTDAPPGSATFTCESATRVPGRCSGYRIPTEAEWEHAARANAWNERYGPLHDIAWSQESGILEPQRVGQLTPNTWGLHDMLGNVWEWTWDTVSNTGAALPADNPESARYEYRVLRGGSYTSPRESVRAAMRFVVLSEYRAPNVGLRLVRSARVRGPE